MMPTIEQVKNNPAIKIGGAYKARCIHYLENYEDLNHNSYEKSILINVDEIVTCVGVHEHPCWDNCVAVQFLYDCKILWYTIYKEQFIDVMTEEFNLIT